MAERKLAGFTLGEKDPVKKTHHDLILFDKLPDGEKVKDEEAIKAIPKVLKKVGYSIIRKPKG